MIAIARTLVTLLLVSTIVFTAFWIHRFSDERRQLHMDEMEVAHITYGMFDPDQWLVILSDILERKVYDFELTGANKEQIHKRASDLMNGLLTELEEVMKTRNREKGIGGAVKNSLMNLLVNVDDIRSGIPRYADMLVEYVNDPRNKQEMQCFVIEKLDELGSKVEGSVDRASYSACLDRYNVADRESALAVISERMAKLDGKLQRAYTVMGGSMVVLLALTLYSRKRTRIPLLGTTLAAIAFLITGLLSPMIDIEARISQFEMQLLGEPVKFVDQVLFHQSKSILDVVRVLWAEQKPELILVAVLVFAFSVLLPVSKLFLTVISLIRGSDIKNRFAEYLLYRAGKWSMADVMVVAIFMAFIGFNGVVDSQMKSLKDHATTAHVLTTNNSSLEVGFYLFTAYCLLGLIISAALPSTLSHTAVGEKLKQ